MELKVDAARERLKIVRMETILAQRWFREGDWRVLKHGSLPGVISPEELVKVVFEPSESVWELEISGRVQKGLACLSTSPSVQMKAEGKGRPISAEATVLANNKNELDDRYPVRRSNLETVPRMTTGELARRGELPEHEGGRATSPGLMAADQRGLEQVNAGAVVESGPEIDLRAEKESGGTGTKESGVDGNNTSVVTCLPSQDSVGKQVSDSDVRVSVKSSRRYGISVRQKMVGLREITGEGVRHRLKNRAKVCAGVRTKIEQKTYDSVTTGESDIHNEQPSSEIRVELNKYRGFRFFRKHRVRFKFKDLIFYDRVKRK